MWLRPLVIIVFIIIVFIDPSCYILRIRFGPGEGVSCVLAGVASEPAAPPRCGSTPLVAVNRLTNRGQENGVWERTVKYSTVRRLRTYGANGASYRSERQGLTHA